MLEKLALAGSQDPVLIQFARNATAFTMEKDPLEEAQGVLHMVQSSVRYVQDPLTAELVTDPRTLVRQIESGRMAYGDCDDMVTLTAAMLLAIGHPIEFVTYSTVPGKPWEHIYLRMYDTYRNRWFSIDPIMKNHTIGFEPPGGEKVMFGAVR